MSSTSSAKYSSPGTRCTAGRTRRLASNLEHQDAVGLERIGIASHLQPLGVEGSGQALTGAAEPPLLGGWAWPFNALRCARPVWREERFRLALEAAARGDEVEHGRLRDSAPMVAYRITHPEYLDRVQASRELALTFAVIALPAIMELRGFLRCAVEHLDEGSPVDAVPADVLARLTDVAGCYAACARLCREEMELEPGIVLGAHLDPLVDVCAAGELGDLGGAELDAEVVECWTAVFRNAWEART